MNKRNQVSRGKKFSNNDRHNFLKADSQEDSQVSQRLKLSKRTIYVI
jgi:hypothetical protein